MECGKESSSVNDDGDNNDDDENANSIEPAP